MNYLLLSFNSNSSGWYDFPTKHKFTKPPTRITRHKIQPFGPRLFLMFWVPFYVSNNNNNKKTKSRPDTSRSQLRNSLCETLVFFLRFYYLHRPRTRALKPKNLTTPLWPTSARLARLTQTRSLFSITPLGVPTKQTRRKKQITRKEPHFNFCRLCISLGNKTSACSPRCFRVRNSTGELVCYK